MILMELGVQEDFFFYANFVFDVVTWHLFLKIKEDFHYFHLEKFFDSENK